MRIFLVFLLPISIIYYLGIFIRNKIYDNLEISQKLDTKVVSIGNINLGGTGKTPFLIYLLGQISNRYKKILILSRGYGSKREGELVDEDGFSDEGRLIKSKFPQVVIWTGKDRIKSYEKYKKKYGTPDIVLLDDGFQHRKIKRDEDIVMINGNLLFGNKLIFPAGPLREPISSIKKRATKIILKDGDEEKLKKLKYLFPHKEILMFNLKDTYLVDFQGSVMENNFFKNKRVLAFCGIANPYSFFEQIESLGIKVGERLIYSDHHNYSEKDIQFIYKNNSDFFITTEKDFVKIKSIWKDKDKLFILVNEYELKEKLVI